MAKCRSCGALIDWVEMEGGKKMPVDREPREMWNPMPGAMMIVKIHGKYSFVMKCPDDPLVPLIRVGISHFATCPNADEHRKGGRE